MDVRDLNILKKFNILPYEKYNCSFGDDFYFVEIKNSISSKLKGRKSIDSRIFLRRVLREGEEPSLSFKEEILDNLWPKKRKTILVVDEPFSVIICKFKDIQNCLLDNYGVKKELSYVLFKERFDKINEAQTTLFFSKPNPVSYFKIPVKVEDNSIL